MNGFKPEPYQTEGARWLHRKRRGLVVSPAGSGKTILAAMALDLAIRARVRERKVRVGWVCNTREQLEQGFKALAMFESIKEQAEVRAHCAAANADWSDRDVLVVDEAHHLMAREWFGQARSCPGAVWGITATDSVEDEARDAGLRDFFGGQVFKIAREEVKNRLVRARVVMLNHSDDNGELMKQEIGELMAVLRRKLRGAPVTEDEIFRNAAWQVTCRTGIMHNARRNDAAVERCLRHMASGQVLALVNNIEHGSMLCDRLGPTARYCNSKMGIKKRREALEGFRTGELRCLVATSLADEGLDLPMASVLMLLSGGRSKVKAEQRTGRVLRSFAGKSEGLIYDFLDLQHPTMANQSRKRVELYRSLGYRIEREDGTELALR